MKDKQKEAVRRTEWKLSEWNDFYSSMDSSSRDLPPMTEEQKEGAIHYLRRNNYPKPADCHEQSCPKYRPACQLGICQIAVGMCGDF